MSSNTSGENLTSNERVGQLIDYWTAKSKSHERWPEGQGVSAEALARVYADTIATLRAADEIQRLQNALTSYELDRNRLAIENVQLKQRLDRLTLEPKAPTDVLAAADRVANELDIHDDDDDSRHGVFAKDLRTLIAHSRAAQPPRADIVTECHFDGPAPAGYESWSAWFDAPVKKGAYLRALTKSGPESEEASHGRNG